MGDKNYKDAEKLFDKKWCFTIKYDDLLANTFLLNILFLFQVNSTQKNNLLVYFDITSRQINQNREKSQRICQN